MAKTAKSASQKYEERANRPPSAADRRGEIYCGEWRARKKQRLWKLGRTNCFERRKREHQRKCGNEILGWGERQIETKFCHKLGESALKLTFRLTRSRTASSFETGGYGVSSLPGEV
jgi:hypothetical protein